MSSQEQKSISIMISGRSYPLKVKVEDESAIRDVVDEINEKVKQFQLSYTTRDRQDALTMVLLSYAIELRKAQATSELSAINQRLKSIDSLLEEVLK